MKPNDDIAAIVRAFSFELDDPATGATVATQNTGVGTIGPVPGGWSGFNFNHQDPATTDSALIWSQVKPPAGAESTQLIGPTAAALEGSWKVNHPGLWLYTDGAGATKHTSALLLSGKAQTTGDAFAQLQLDSTGPTASGSLNAFDTNGNFGNVEVDANAGGVATYITASGPAYADVIIAADQDINVQVVRGRITLGPNSRPAYLPLGKAQLFAAGGAIPPYSSFLANGITVTGRDGDQVTLTYSIEFGGYSAAHSFRAGFQIFGPTGNVLSGPLMGLDNLAAGGLVSTTAVFAYTFGLGSGAYTFTVIGGMLGGTATMFVNQLTSDHIGIR